MIVLSRRNCLLFGAAVLPMLFLPIAGSQVPKPIVKVEPKLEAVAETKLLMEGLALVNFRGLEKILTQKTIDQQSWTFARGQALLLAETANLLMIRPPKTQGQAMWFERCMELRRMAASLAKDLSRRDVNRSHHGLVAVANSCNRCHQSFRISVEIVPFQESR